MSRPAETLIAVILRARARLALGLLARVVWGAALWLALLGLPARAFNASMPIPTDDKSGIKITLVRPYEELPALGCFPVTATIQNGSKDDHVWSFVFNASAGYSRRNGGDGTRFEQNVAVKAGQSVEVQWPVPLSGRTNSSYTNLSVMVSGYGIDGATTQNLANSYSRGRGSNERPALLVIGAVSGSGGPEDVMINEVSTDLFPNDWRDLIGMAGIAMEAGTFGKLRVDQQQAMRIYVARGGTIYVLGNLGGRSVLGEVNGTYGAGFVRNSLPEITIIPGSASATTRTSSSSTSSGGSSSTKSTLNISLDKIDPAAWLNVSGGKGTYSNDWSLRSGMESAAIPRTLVLVFVLAFAILIGPVNLFVLAPNRYRYRLFWTTPLISIAATLVLLIVIFAVEGMGGAGRQVFVTLLLPEMNKEVTVQEEVARTGVLFSPTFTPPNATYVESLPVIPNDGSQYENERRAGDNLEIVDGVYRGGWFGSRSLEAQWLETVRDSRGRISLTNAADVAKGAAPTIVSQISATLSKFYYVDQQHHVWSCSSLKPGVEQSCRLVQQSELDALYAEARKHGGPRLISLVNGLEIKGPGWFFARAENDSRLAISTLEAIRWDLGDAFFAGALVNEGVSPTTTPAP